MRCNSSCRSAYVTNAVDDDATIRVSQPSDCLVLKRDDIVCTEVDVINVWLGSKFTSQMYGPAQLESPEMWQTALHHILSTYKPRHCYFHTGGSETGLGAEVRVEGEEQGNYAGFWDVKKRVLCVIR